ncbi:hypothetical protein GCM10010969_32560 [Saccharibacillus kuerlensis]|uniref:SpoOB alpha-helical domain-containing protein n=2 Tax=Saccharibacillus kuerlensis TaxID=459527 RepID=A0ABQ2L7F6_9BACL|nr:hypothetical protein GCM10010969_32560 [Saccharibacillus kuerlensis]
MPLSVAVPLILAWIFPRAVMFVLLAVWLAGVFLLMSGQERRRRKRELEELRQSLQQFFLDVLSHQRHDWMNELQVIFGYARMGKTERVGEIVERVSEDMHRESRIAKLGLPELVFYLMTIKGENREIALRVEVDEDLHYAGSLTLEEEAALVRALRAGMAAYRYSGMAERSMEPALRIVFGEQGGEATLFIETDTDTDDDSEAAPMLHHAVKEALKPCTLPMELIDGGTLIRWKLPV